MLENGYLTDPDKAIDLRELLTITYERGADFVLSNTKDNRFNCSNYATTRDNFIDYKLQQIAEKTINITDTPNGKIRYKVGKNPEEETKRPKSIYNLELHEALEITKGVYVLRVPGGWIYNYEKPHVNILETVFVPLSLEFQGPEVTKF
jgi:hypothetical protein